METQTKKLALSVNENILEISEHEMHKKHMTIKQEENVQFVKEIFTIPLSISEKIYQKEN